RGERSRADAEYEASLREVVEHRRLSGDHYRVRLREVGGPGRELDRLGLADQRREENEAVGDVLAAVGEVLADEGVVESEPVREDDRLAVLLQRLRRIAVRPMQRHRKVAQTHGRNVPNRGSAVKRARLCLPAVA